MLTNNDTVQNNQGQVFLASVDSLGQLLVISIHLTTLTQYWNVIEPTHTV